MKYQLILAIGLAVVTATAQAPVLIPLTRGKDAPSFSGIYPHLASFNRQNECGTGAVVAWADMLWWVTYAPHKPDGSDDKLYAMNAEKDLFVSSKSIGGTPANRMIHVESKQLFIGPYAIDAAGTVRAIPYAQMRGRPTGNARHLSDPANKIYYATMEEGLYEVDVETLAVKTLFTDNHLKRPDEESGLPGYHGKGLYSGQGVLVYSNNGERGKAAQTRPDISSGVLAQWNGKGRGPGQWQVVRRNQFTEVTGPGGIRGSRKPASDPLWSVGWDHRSVILMLRSAKGEPGGAWHRFRLPKASHSYDGAHGWNTEWPRIREIGEDDLLMTMHGTFWRFPSSFDLGATQGIAPRSTYLKVIGDFCRYGEHVVFGCDDAAKSEFLNKRRAKGEVAGPAESQSNLWFVAPEAIDHLGPASGHAGLFVDDAVEASSWSDPLLFQGYDLRAVHLVHDASTSVEFRFEVDQGDGVWKALEKVTVDSAGYAFHAFDTAAAGAWIRVCTDQACTTTVWFEFRDHDERSIEPTPVFDALATAGQKAIGGLLRAGDRKRGLQILATSIEDGTSRTTGYYELRPDMEFLRVEDATRAVWMQEKVAIPRQVVKKVGDSILYVDDSGQRWRLPIGNLAYSATPELLELQRTCREVATERDLLHCAGSFFEMPARNAGGMAKIRPVATHPFFVQDYCSWRGLIVLSGLQVDRAAGDSHVLASEDGKAALWLGTIDDLWQLGKAVGFGGPWTGTLVKAGAVSDPFLMRGYDRKSVILRHDAEGLVRFDLEVDITGTGAWRRYRRLEVKAERVFEFPAEFSAYWVRARVDQDCVATVRFEYQ